MQRSFLLLGVVLVLLPACEPEGSTVPLPPPARAGTMSLEEALAGRRSHRAFRGGRPTPGQVSQLLWAAQGVTHAPGRRTAPSAGALYPLEVYVVSAQGLHHYDPRSHGLRRRGGRDLRSALQGAALSQEAIGTAPTVFVIAAVKARTARKYGGRATRYVHMEAGHAAQNLLLQATALGLGGVTIGAFEDDRVRQVLSLPADQDPLYLIPVGVPKS